MSRSSPSLLALLGLVAVAGYQNRGRISEMLSDAHRGGSKTTGSTGYAPGGAGSHMNQQSDIHSDKQSGGFLSEIGRIFQPDTNSGLGGAGSTSITSALGDLVDRFRQNGRTEAVDSWVSDRPNMPLNVSELEAVLGEDTMEELSQKVGLSRQELLLRLNTALPEVVNRFTPQGRLPTPLESANLA